MPANKLKDYDIILLADGSTAQVMDASPWAGDTICLLYVDSNEYSYVDSKSLKVEHNFGNDPTATMNFHLAHGLHVRLNRLAKV